MHYKIWNATIYQTFINAGSIVDRKAILEKALRVSKHSQQSLALNINPATNMYATDSKKMKTRITGILFVATTHLSFDTLCGDELQAFVDCAGGTIDKSKSPYLSILSDLHEVVLRIFAVYTSSVKDG